MLCAAAGLCTCTYAADGLFTQMDAAKHAAMRDVLAPAFRAEYVAQVGAACGLPATYEADPHSA